MKTDLGLSFDSKSADQMPKNHNWLFGGIKCFFHLNEFGLLEGNMTCLLILHVVTRHQMILVKVVLQALLSQAPPPLPSSQLILCQSSKPGLYKRDQVTSHGC